MRYVVLSFDDGRKDFYTNAFPILKKYHMPATLNIVTEYLGKESVPGFSESDGKFINKQELETMLTDENCELEVASHSADHSNNIEAIKKGINDLKMLGFGRNIGFASPFSEICTENYHQYKSLIPDWVHYIRSGNQIRRDGLVHAGLWLLYKITKSTNIFNIYNKRNIINNHSFDPRTEWFPSVSCCMDNTITQLISFIDKIPDNSSVVICFHSITDRECDGKYRNCISDFDFLCDYLHNNKNVCVVTNMMLTDIILENTQKRMNNK